MLRVPCQYAFVDRRIVNDLTQIDQPRWAQIEPEDSPFFDYANLTNLEQSGSAQASTGWAPYHFVFEEGDELRGAIPCYLKNHSYGEYIFDWDWAEAYRSHGMHYYPKLVAAIPFTPATNLRILGDIKVQNIEEGLREHCKEIGASSFHFLFLTEEEAHAFRDTPWIVRHTHQFHWFNKGYENFEAFLEDLKKKRRREIRRERQKIIDQGIEIRCLQGEHITIEDLERMHELYLKTTDKKWGQSYLNRAYFKGLLNQRDQLLLFQAIHGDAVVGQSICFQKGSKLYGRYWGSFVEIDSLHFELCYYSLIEYAIQNKLAVIEAGAQGPHKINRGFMPIITYSAHWIEDERFREAILRAVQQENRALEIGLQRFAPQSPFRQRDDQS